MPCSVTRAPCVQQWSGWGVLLVIGRQRLRQDDTRVCWCQHHMCVCVRQPIGMMAHFVVFSLVERVCPKQTLQHVSDQLSLWFLALQASQLLQECGMICVAPGVCVFVSILLLMATGITATLLLLSFHCWHRHHYLQDTLWQQFWGPFAALAVFCVPVLDVPILYCSSSLSGHGRVTIFPACMVTCAPCAARQQQGLADSRQDHF